PELQANDATAAVLPRRVDVPLRFLDIEMDHSLADAPARLASSPAVEVLAVVQPGEAFLRRSIVRSARSQWQGDEGDDHATAADESHGVPPRDSLISAGRARLGDDSMKRGPNQRARLLSAGAAFTIGPFASTEILQSQRDCSHEICRHHRIRAGQAQDSVDSPYAPAILSESQGKRATRRLGPVHRRYRCAHYLRGRVAGRRGETASGRPVSQQR